MTNTTAPFGRLLTAMITPMTPDGAVDYAQEIPVRVIAHMLGVPEDDAEQFRKWIKEILEIGITAPEQHQLHSLAQDSRKAFDQEVEAFASMSSLTDEILPEDRPPPPQG